MYSYNSFHKIIGVGLVIFWAIFQFQSRKEENLHYEDGAPIRTGETKDNLNHGTWTWYHQNGKVQITGEFIKGKREGVWKSYDTLGNILLESTYNHNLLNGLFVQYDSQGKVIRKEMYKEDQLIKSLPF